MKSKPIHEDIKKYDYTLQYSPSKDVWYAAYDTDSKGASWYEWDGVHFNPIFSSQLPKDLE